MRRIEWVVLHTAAGHDRKSGTVVHQRMEAIDRYHREHNGWRKIGYHIYVEEDGLIRRGREDAEIGAHVAAFNHDSLGLCVSGHGDYEPWNEAQVSAVVLQCCVWIRRYPGLSADRVIGHAETDEHGGPPVYKTCPGRLVDMTSIRGLVRQSLAGT